MTPLLIGILVSTVTVITPVATPVLAAPGLGISKSASSEVVEAGETFDYRLLVSCSSTTGDCVDAEVVDILPPELSGAIIDVFVPPLVGATASYDQNTRTVTWTFTNDLGGGEVGLATGSTVELLLTVKFPAGSTPDGTIATNQASFSADTDGDGTLETSTSNPQAVRATATFGFNAIKSVRGGAANIGLPVTYDIELCSDPSGALDMEPGATLQDTLPSGAQFISATGGGAEVPPGSGVIEWTLPRIAADGLCRVVASATVLFPAADFADNDPVTNIATVLDPVPLGGDPTNPAPPVVASLTHPVIVPTGVGGGSKAGPAWITPGQSFDYTLVIDSAGFLPITDVVMIDDIPAQVDVTSVTVPAGVDRAFYTSDDDPSLRALAFTPGVAVAKADLVVSGDYVARLQFEADSVGAVQTLTVTLGASVLDGLDRTGAAITEGAAQGDGDTVTNCQQISYTDHTGNPQVAAPACTSTLVKAEFAVPRIQKSGDEGPYLPGATVSWQIDITNDGAASTDLDDFVVRDLLPDQYDNGTPVALTYVAGSASVISKPAGAPDPVISDSTTDPASGRRLVEWRWTSADATSYSLAPGETITLAYDARLANPTPPGVITNHASLSDWTNGPSNPDPDRSLVWNCVAPSQLDADLLAVNGVTAADLADPEAVNPPCFDSSPIGVQAITGLNSIKWVRGEADVDAVITAGGNPDDADPQAAGFTRFPSRGLTYPGGYVDYRIVLNNPGNVPIDDLVILDIFPYIGDSGVLTGARGSQWRPIMVTPVVLPPALAGQADVYYSAEQNPCRDARLKVPAGCTDWSLTPPTPISDVQAVLIDFRDDYFIPVNGRIEIPLELTAPAGTPIDGSVAWNSFGFSSARADTGGLLLPAEPRKVGIELRVPANGIYGDYVWFDFDHDGRQDPEESGPALEDQPLRPTGINGVRVQFYEDLGVAGPSADDRFVRVTYTADDFAGNPGGYSFPELDAGSYYAVFDVPLGYQLSLPNAAADTADSDAVFGDFSFEGAAITDTGAPFAGQVVVPPTFLGLDESDLTWDVGFWQPGLLRSSLGDVVFYDNDTSGTQDLAPDGVANVTVNLWWVGEDGLKNDGTGDDIRLQTTTTGISGAYRFDWLVAGPNYYVQFVRPSGTQFTVADVGADDTFDSDAAPSTGFTAVIDLDNGPDPATTGWNPDIQTVEPQWDAGLFFPTSIGNFVWEDVNRDGVQNVGEPGIVGSAVRLYSAGADGAIGGGDDALIASTTTVSGGSYSFQGLPVGDYFVVVGPLATYQATLADVAPDDAVDSDGVAGSGTYAGSTVMSSVTRLEVLPGPDGRLNSADDVAENELTWDFGYFRLASLGNFVWEDLDRDGLQDAGEPGVAGVTVYLLDSGGATVATTTTNASGLYLFSNLLPGTYSVRVDPSTAPTTVDRPWFFSPRDAGANNAVDSDVDPLSTSPTFAQTVPTTLTSNESDLSWDAGLWRYASIGDRVWHDLDADGVQEAGESGISGVQVFLLDSAGTVVASTSTDGTGAYRFDNIIPGNYSVRFDQSSPSLVGAGFVPTARDVGLDTADSDASLTDGRTITTQLTSNETDLTWDAGFYIPVTLGNFVWYDDDVDGIADGTESGLDGVTVRLRDSGGTIIATTVTAPAPLSGLLGWYEFANLRPGTYEVEFVAPGGHSFSPYDIGADEAVDSDALPTTGRTGPIVLVSGTDDFSWDAGVYEYAALGDFVWEDLDADGAQDAGEPGINGVTVRLLDAGGSVVATTVTAANPVGGAPGWYLFDRLPPGTYSVQFDLASPALSGFVVSPIDATADANDSDANTTTGRTAPTVLVLGELDTTVDAGFYRQVSLGNFVWDDFDGDGIQDAGEPGIPGVTVVLRDGAGTEIATTVTNGTGFYQFASLVPGTYSVRFDLASAALTGPGYVLTAAGAGADTVDSDAAAGGTTPNTVLVSGGTDQTIDAGFYIPVVVGNYVWEDQNGDGFQTAGEPGVSGVRVTLVNGAGADVATTVTDGSGLYLFPGLLPGSYSVRFDLTSVPAGLLPTVRDADANVSNGIDSDADPVTGATAPTPVLRSGQSDLTLDMGLVVPVVVGNKVWHDLDGDGVQDAAEPGIDDVTVRLFRIDPLGGPPIASGATTTSASGEYLFTGLRPGRYFAEFDLGTLPSGMVATFVDRGANDAADSDADRTTGRTSTTAFLFSRQSDLTLDLGAYLPVTVGDVVWDDLDGDGVQDAGEPGVAGVVVYLLDSSGNRVTDGAGADLTVTTDSLGAYQFSALPPAAYAVEFDLTTLPAGYVVTLQDVGVDDTVDSDADPLSGVSATGPLMASGGADPDHDLGVFRPVSVGDFVFDDFDGDGVQDAGEPGVGGVGVALFRVDPLGGAPIASGTTVTSAAGGYLFTDLQPGEYYVVFDLATLPAGYVVTFQDAGGNDALDSDADPLTGATAPTAFLTSGSAADLSLDMGLFRPVSVGDFVFEDADGDGVQDSGEPGVGGVGVALFRVDPLGGAPIASGTTTTSSTGGYLFTDLQPGEYFVVFDLATAPAGYVVTFQDAGGNDALDSDADPFTGATAPTAFLTSGSAADLSLDMGLFDPVSVGDFVWDDLDGDGTQDAGEPGIADVDVTIYSVGPDGVPGGGDDVNVDTTTTSPTGQYRFIGLDPGEYYVVFDLSTLPADYVVTLADQGAEPTDSDADPVTGVTRPTGFLPSQADDPDLDLGVYRPVSVGDRVWFDLSGNGLQDAGEPGVGNVGVTLFSVGADGAAGTADDITVGAQTTNATGDYMFTGLRPDSYYVVFDLATLPAGNVVTFADAGDDALDSDADRITGRTPATGVVLSGTSNVTLDMGVVVPVDIGDFVWQDTNADGLQDAGEPGVEGVTVRLFEVGIDGLAGTADDRLVTSTTTDALGAYLFADQDPGNYFVEIDLSTVPSGFVVTFQNIGADDSDDSDADRVTGRTPATGFLDGSGAATDDLTLDVGLYAPATLGNLVWEDRNGNGIQDAGEPGVAGVVVELRAAGADGVLGTTDDVVVDSTTTSSTGEYLFEDIVPGEYYVAVDLTTLPAGAVFTLPGQGCADVPPGSNCAVDSDVDPSTGLSGVIDLGFGEIDLTVDAGLYVPFDLGLVKTAEGRFVRGSTGTFLLVVSNAGPGTAFGPLVVTDVLPTGMTLSSFSGTGWLCAASGQIVACSHDADLPANGRSELRLIVNIAGNAPSGLVNEATVASVTSGALDASGANNTAATAAIQVLSRAVLPATGMNGGAIVRGALQLVLVGALLTAVSWRRRSRRSLEV